MGRPAGELAAASLHSQPCPGAAAARHEQGPERCLRASISWISWLMYIHTKIYIYIYIYGYIHTYDMYIYMHIQKYMCGCIRVYTHICIHMCIYVYVYRHGIIVVAASFQKLLDLAATKDFGFGVCGPGCGLSAFRTLCPYPQHGLTMPHDMVVLTTCGQSWYGGAPPTLQLPTL